MRRAAKVDDNQRAIVSALRRAGVRVHITSSLGGGFPDILAARGDVMKLIEIKDGAKVPSDRRLTDAEAAFHAAWSDHAAIVETVEQALDVMGVRIA